MGLLHVSEMANDFLAAWRKRIFRLRVDLGNMGISWDVAYKNRRIEWDLSSRNGSFSWHN